MSDVGRTGKHWKRTMEPFSPLSRIRDAHELRKRERRRGDEMMQPREQQL